MELQERSPTKTGIMEMSEMFSFPRYGAHQIQIQLERAEAFINAFCKLSGHVNSLLTRAITAAPEIGVLTHDARTKASA